MTIPRAAANELAHRCAAAGYDPRKALADAIDELQPDDHECTAMLLQLLQIRAGSLESLRLPSSRLEVGVERSGASFR